MTRTFDPATSVHTTESGSAGEEAGAARAPAYLVVLFVVYLGLLAWVVLWKLEVPWVGEPGERIVKLMPFVSTAGAGASTPFDVAANLVLFVPFGLYLGLLAPTWRWWKAAGVMAAASLALETGQYVLAVGSTDTTDVIVNTAGGLAGLALVRGTLPRCAAMRLCAVGTLLAVLASAVVVATPVRYGPPEDVRCDPTASVPCLPSDDRGRP